MIKFSCSKCGKHIRVDDKYAGKRGKCPRCGEAVLVPGKSAAIRFSCEHCGHAIKVPERYAGKKGKCPKCQQTVIVPGPKQEPAKAPQGPTVTCSLCGAAIPQTDDEFVECPECGSFVYAASGAPADAEEAPPTEGQEDVEDEYGEPARESEVTSRRLLLILGGVAAVVIVGVIGLIVFLKLSQPEPPRRPAPPRRARQVADTETQEQAEPQTTASTPPSAPAEEPATAAPAPAVRLRFAPAPGITRFVQVATERHFTAPGDALQLDLREQETLTFELEAAAPDADGNIPITVTLAAVQMKRDTDGTTVGDYDSTEPPDSTNRFGKLCAPFVSGRLRMAVSAQGRIVGFDTDELYRAVAEIRLAALGDGTDPRYPSREEHLQVLKTQSENSPILGKKQLRSALEALVAALPEQPLRVGDTWSDHSTVQMGAPIDMPVTYTLAAADDTCTIEAEAQRGTEAEPVVLGSDQMTLSYALSGISEATLTVDHPTGWLLSKQQKTNLSGQIETHFAEKPDQDSTNQVSIEITTTVATIPTGSDSTSPGTQGSERPLPATGPVVQLRFAPAAGTKRTMRVTTRLDTSVPAAGQQQNVTGIESVTLDLEATPTNADGTVPVKVTLAAIQVKTEMGGMPMGEYDSTNVQDSAEAFAEMYGPFVGEDFTMTFSDRGEIVDFGLDELFRAVAEHRVHAEDVKIQEDLKFQEKAKQAIARVDQRFGSRENRLLAMKKQLEEFPIFGKDKLCGLLGGLAVFLPEKPLRDGDRWSYPIAVAQVDRRLRMPTLHTLTAVEDGTCTIHSEGERALEEEPFVQESGTLRVTHRLGGSSSANVTVDRRTGWLLSKDQKTNLSGQIETVGSGQPDQDTTVEVSLEITTTITALE